MAMRAPGRAVGDGCGISSATCRQFEPDTEVPEASIFGPEPGRVAPHIYRDDEIVDLLAAARRLGPAGSLAPDDLRNPVRPDGLDRIARVRSHSPARCRCRSQARDADDTADQVRQVPAIADPSRARSRRWRATGNNASGIVPTTPDMPFLIGSRGRRLGQPLGDRQAHRVFTALRDSLGWVNRGATRCAAPARPAPHLCRPAPDALVCRRHRRRPDDAGAVDLHGPCRDLLHVLVPHRRSRVDGDRCRPVRALRRSRGR